MHRYILTLILSIILPALAAAQDQLTITSLTSEASEGIVLTFNRDVTVSHNLFGTKCYTQFDDLDGNAGLNARVAVAGNRVTLTPLYCTFVNGHRYTIAFDPKTFHAANDPAMTLSGKTTWDFTMGAGHTIAAIQAIMVAPASGERTKIDNITVTLSPALEDIVKADGITVHNEQGHSLPIVRCEALNEGNVMAININLDCPVGLMQEGTTYSLHVAPGAIRCGGTVNSDELVFGKWTVPASPLTLVTTPAPSTMTDDLYHITVAAANGAPMKFVRQPADLTLTGVGDDQHMTFATVETVQPLQDGASFEITLSNHVTPELVESRGAYNLSAKLNIPEGAFVQGSHTNRHTQFLWATQHSVTPGTAYWSFEPAQSAVTASIGTPTVIETENGKTQTIYTVGIRVAGDHVYATITNPGAIRILNDETGATVHAFGAGDLIVEGTNNFALRLPDTITQQGVYVMIIPADAIAIYGDEQHYSTPIHPLTDLEVIWYVGAATGLDIIPAATPATAPVYDLSGRRTTAPHGVSITAGRKVMQ